MSKNILLPTDFSDNAWSAAVYAMKLYKNEVCTFHFLYSSKMKVSSMTSISNKLVEAIAENAKADLAELKAKVEKEYPNPNHKFEVILSTNILQNAIDVLVEKEAIDLIVMGTQGATLAKELMFGSNTVNAIKHSNACPLLVIPNEFSYVEPKEIAFPTDYNHNYGEELDALKDLADLYNSVIRIVHIDTEDHLNATQKQHLALLKLSLEAYECSFHWQPQEGKKAKAIQEFTEALEINMLVMIRYQHSFIENLIKEPIINSIGFHPNIPFLVIPQN